MLWDAATLTPIHRYEAAAGCRHRHRVRAGGERFLRRAHRRLLAAVRNRNWRRRRASPMTTTSPAMKRAASRRAADEPPRVRTGRSRNRTTSPAAANEISANAVVRGVIGDAGRERRTGRRSVSLSCPQGSAARAGNQRRPAEVAARFASWKCSTPPATRFRASCCKRCDQRTSRSAATIRPTLTDFRLHGWQDMELNEYLYANGEVVKLWMYPRGPDSGFLVYPGVGGNRYTYFGTTAITHALNEPCYIVEPHPPGTKLIPNGLPQYTLYYENDDDGWRKLGSRFASRVHRAGRRRLSGSRLRRARPGRRRLQVRARRARAAPRFSNQGRSRRT